MKRPVRAPGKPFCVSRALPPQRRTLRPARALLIVSIVGVPLVIAAGFVGWRLLRAKPPAPAEDRRWVEVTRVRHGDKIKIDSDDEEVLYAGILAPPEGQPFYEESKKRNTALVEGKKVRLRFDDDKERDKKGRLNAYAFIDQVFVNETLVREGLAYVRLTADHQRYAKELLAAQAQARTAKRGIWSHPLAPLPEGCIGDPKYGNVHRPNCEELAKVPDERELPLKSLDEAFARGLAPCVHCRPGVEPAATP